MDKAVHVTKYSAGRLLLTHPGFLSGGGREGGREGGRGGETRVCSNVLPPPPNRND